MESVNSFEAEWTTSQWNPANFEEVVLQYQHRIYKFIYRLIREEPLAQDLTQDTFLQVYRAMCKRAAIQTKNQFQVKTTPPMLPWLYKVARNNVISEVRRRKKMQFSSFWQSDANGMEYELTAIGSLSQFEMCNELESRFVVQDELERAIALTGKTQLVALLLYLDGYSYQEISKITNSSLSSVKTQIFRAKKSLRQRLLAQQNLAEQPSAA